MPEPSVQQEFESAVQHHQAGRLAEAEKHYRLVLARKPNQPDALHLLGVLAAQVRRFDAAVELIGRAVAINPTAAEYHCNLANALRESGQIDKAIDAYRRSVELKPGLGTAHNSLANALREKGSLDDALASHRQAIKSDPTSAQAHADMGLTLAVKGQVDDAIRSYRQSLRLSADNSQTWNNLGIALMEKDQLPDAIAAFRQSLRLKPDHQAQNNLANALSRDGQFDEAIAASRQATLLKPDSADVWNNLGLILREAGQLDEAIAASSQAIRLSSDMVYPHWNLAQALLRKGDYERGWAEYEWRWRWKDFPSPARNFPQPQWGGEALNGRTILLHAEQGLGDVIQFVRYAPMVAGRGGRVLLECSRATARLFQCLPNVNPVFADETLPPFDLHCPLMSLPLAFGTRVETIPAKVPYLHVDPALAEVWKQKLGARTGRLRVGLVWAGNPKQVIDKRRSITLSHLAPLAGAMGITFYSLQKGYAAAQVANPPAGMELIDLTADIEDFADTAALICNLDLVISTCTSVAHLAGALGKKTWMMLSHLPDWRWLVDRDDSPWYPTMRLFRQTKLGDWTGVVERVADALGRLIS